MTTEDARNQFLIEMYKAMWDNVNRHIGVIWHSITVLVGAGAVFGLVQRQVIPIDFAITLIVIVAAWQLAHVYDASYWVNRNLSIIRNLECQFLRASDLLEIHYYFGRLRQNRMIEHFQVQFSLGVAVAVLALLYHALNQGWPAGRSPKELMKILPYLVALVGAIFVAWIGRRHADSYAKLLAASPGAAIAEQKGTE